MPDFPSDKTSVLDIIDTSFPGAEGLPAAGDEEFVSSFAAFFRSYLDSTSSRFFSIPYEKPENVYTLPGESEREAADRICRGTLVSVGVPSDFGCVENVNWHSNPTYNGYKEWTWQFSRHNDIKLLAHEFILTGDRKYADAAAALLSSWIRTCPVPGPDVPGSDTDCWRTIECGIRMGANWPYIIYAFYKVFPDELLRDIAVSLNQHGERLQRNHMHGNWLLMEMNGLEHIGVLFPFLRKAASWRAFALDAMEKEAEKQFYPDGMQYELTTGYHEVAINNYKRMLDLLHAFSLPMPENLIGIMQNAAEADVKLMECDGRLPDINDGTPLEVSALLEPKRGLFGTPVIDWGATKGREGKKPDYTSVAMPYSGLFVFRSGWGSDDVYALLDSAPFGRGHQHEDKLSLIASAGCHRVITEGGCYAYDDSPMRMHTISSEDHNVLLIDGKGQNRRKSYEWHDEEIRKLSDLKWGVSDSVDWAEGAYDGPYGDDEEHPARWVRTVFFIKRHPVIQDPLLIVVDRTESEKEHEYCWLWHVDSERLSIAPESASYADVLLSFSGSGDLSVTRGRMNPVGGYIATGKEQGMYKAVDRLEYRRTASSTRLVTAIAFGDPLEAVMASSDPSDDSISITIAGEEVILSEKDMRV